MTNIIDIADKRPDDGPPPPKPGGRWVRLPSLRIKRNGTFVPVKAWLWVADRPPPGRRRRRAA